MVTSLTSMIGRIVGTLLLVANPFASDCTNAHEVANEVAHEVANEVANEVASTATINHSSMPPVVSPVIDHADASLDDMLTIEQQACLSIDDHDAPIDHHRFWLISTRHLTWNTRCANLDRPNFIVYRMNRCGATYRSSLDEYLQSIRPNRRVVFYVHGNRTTTQDAIGFGLNMFNRVRPHLDNRPTDWVVFSWPSAKVGGLVKDAREKAFRTDAEGLYLAWLTRKHIERSSAIAMIGYSFGARVISGSLHAIGGGSLGNRMLGGQYYLGADVSVGMIAAALDSDWMTPNHYHSNTTKNIQTLTLLYNRRDVALRNYWRVSRQRSSQALGFSGPRCFGPRIDGSRLPVHAVNCTTTVRAQHAERLYYERHCNAGHQMACLINKSIPSNHLQPQNPVCELASDIPSVRVQ